MKLFITGDIHGKLDFQKLQSSFFPQESSLYGEDVLIIAGDFGLPLLPDNTEEDYYLDDLASRKYTTLFIDGNHEHFDLLAGLDTGCHYDGPVGILRPKVLHLRRGNIYNIGGLSFFVLGGARSISNMAGYRFDSREIPSEREFQRGLDSLEEQGWKVDCVLTHAAPARFLSRLYKTFIPCPVSKYLDGIFDRLNFTKWFCGHYHRDIDFLNTGVHFLSERILRLDTSATLECGTKLENFRAGLEEGRDWIVYDGLL
ncbi:MAG: serine/threonine protein phosphatase [Bacteroidia bacterium]|nr:serine/threonine protein phosphatase [Bacteroidia bacterium]